MLRGDGGGRDAAGAGLVGRGFRGVDLASGDGAVAVAAALGEGLCAEHAGALGDGGPVAFGARGVEVGELEEAPEK